MEMRKREVIKKHRKMWRKLTENPSWEKEDYILKIYGFRGLEVVENDCYLCAYDSSVHYRVGCTKCNYELMSESYSI